MDYPRRHQQEMNQILSQAGRPAILDDDWIAISCLSTGFNRGSHSFDALSTHTLRAFERDLDMRMLGRDALVHYRHDVPLIIDYEGSPYDPDNPLGFTGRFALLVCDPTGLIPLDTRHDWRWACGNFLSRNTLCDSRISKRCTARDLGRDGFKPATKFRRIVNGDYDVLFKCCKECVDWITDPNREALRSWNLGRPDQVDYVERTYRNPKKDDPMSDEFDPWD